MYDAIPCPQCNRRLELPAEHVGKQVQCPACETTFVAGAASPTRPPLPTVVLADPNRPASAAPEPRAGGRRNKSRRVREREPADAPTKKSSTLSILILLAIGAGAVAMCLFIGMFSQRTPKPGIPPAPKRLPELFDDFPFRPEPPLSPQPEPLLTPEKRHEHAAKFFDYFRRVMNNADLAAEIGCFDADKILESLIADKYFVRGLTREPRIAANLGRTVLQTSLYRHQWSEFKIMTVKQPQARELTVVTMHPNQDSEGAVRYRWRLGYRDGRWRIQEVEDLDYGIHLSMLLAAELQAGALVHPDVATLRQVANAVVIKVDFDEAERLLTGLRPENLPRASAGTRQLLLAWIRARQKRDDEVLQHCDAAEKLDPTLAGVERLRCIVYNNQRRPELALKHADEAREWYGDDSDLFHQQGLAWNALGQPAKAATFFRKALDGQPNHFNAMLSLLRCNVTAEDGDLAARFLKMQRATEYFEQFARDCWQARDAVTLRQLAEAMSNKAPSRPDGPFYLSLALADLELLDLALPKFRTAVARQDFDVPRDNYFREFAVAVTSRDLALQAYQQMPHPDRAFRALAEQLRITRRPEELKELIELHSKNQPKDDYLELYRAALHFIQEEYALADRAFTKAFKRIKDHDLQSRFQYDRVLARYHTGDVVGAYREIGPRSQVFSQLAELCWSAKKKELLEELLKEHARNEPGDPQAMPFGWRVQILDQRFAEAAKAAKTSLPAKRDDEFSQSPTQNFLMDMIDSGYAMQAYEHAPNPREAFEFMVGDITATHFTRELGPIAARHRKRFPDDPMLFIFDGLRGAAQQDWASAAAGYQRGWKQLPEAKRGRWTYPYLFAQFKAGKAAHVYQQTGAKPDTFRQLVSMILREKQTEIFERLLDAHRVQRVNDPDFDAYEARLKILRGQPADAPDLIKPLLAGRTLEERRRIGDSFMNDLGGYDVAAEIYRCMPEKLDAFSQLVWRYRNAKRLAEFERLITEHTKYHPSDPRLLTERAELHMLKKEYRRAEELFALGKAKGQRFDPAEFGWIRARIKLGQAAETYRRLGPSTRTFHDVANGCVTAKDADQLAEVLNAHRQAFPKSANSAIWLIEVDYLKKDYQAVVKSLKGNITRAAGSSNNRWKAESYLIRSLVRMKQSAQAVQQAEALHPNQSAPQLLLALALASTGDPGKLEAYLHKTRAYRDFVEDCYFDEDLGPILRSDAFNAFRERFPAPNADGRDFSLND